MKSTLLILSFLLFGTFQIEANNFNPTEISTEDPITYSWSDSNINIYPNPATNFFSISNFNSEIVKVDVFNILGRKMGSFEIDSNNHYEISSYPKGMYLVQFIGANQDVLKTIRLNKR